LHHSEKLDVIMKMFGNVSTGNSGQSDPFNHKQYIGQEEIKFMHYLKDNHRINLSVLNVNCHRNGEQVCWTQSEYCEGQSVNGSIL
jgi:hypothetical protein